MNSRDSTSVMDSNEDKADPTLTVPGDRDGPNAETVTQPHVDADRKAPVEGGTPPLPIKDIETFVRAMRSVVNIATGKTEVEDTFDDPIANASLAGGRIALYTPSDSRIRVYGNAAASRLGRALFETGLDRVGGIALSGDGNTVAAGYVGLGGAANRLYAWSVGSGEELLAAAVVAEVAPALVPPPANGSEASPISARVIPTIMPW